MRKITILSAAIAASLIVAACQPAAKEEEPAAAEATEDAAMPAEEMAAPATGDARSQIRRCCSSSCRSSARCCRAGNRAYRWHESRSRQLTPCSQPDGVVLLHCPVGHFLIHGR